MEKPRRVLLYGKSVILGTLEASLKRYPQMEISVLSTLFPTVQELKTMAPDVVIFDTAAPRPEAAFTLLETYPGYCSSALRRTGMKCWCSPASRRQALSVADLVNIIHQKDFTSKPFWGENREKNHQR